MSLSKELSLLKQVQQDIEIQSKRQDAYIITLDGQKEILIEELEKARRQNYQLLLDLHIQKQKLKRAIGGSSITATKSTRPAITGVFPEELWRLVFDHVLDSNDLKNCFEAHVEFRPLLEHRRTTFLFKDVVKILAKSVQNFGIPQPYQTTRSMNPVMNCRIVCQQWRNGVDAFLSQESPSFSPIPKENCTVPAFQFKFLGADNIPRVNPETLRSLGPNINPIPTGYLVYSDNYRYRTQDQERTEFEQRFSRFLTKFGKLVKTFKIEFSLKYFDEEKGYGYFPLLRFLEKMPNLKELYLSKPVGFLWNTDSSDVESLDSFHDYSFPNEFYKDNRLANFQNALLTDFFPYMPDIKRLVFEDCPSMLIDMAISACPQAKKIKLVRSPNNNHGNNLSELELFGIEELHLINYSIKYLFTLRYCPLSKLIIDSDSVNLHHLSLISAESKFQKTLKELVLRLHGPFSRSEVARLDLPELKTLKLKLSGWFYSVDFILPLIKLGNLEIDLTDMSFRKQGGMGLVQGDYIPAEAILEIIKIHNCINNLKQSNVWQMLPNLNQVRARSDWNPVTNGRKVAENPKWYFCTREDFEKHKATKENF